MTVLAVIIIIIISLIIIVRFICCKFINSVLKLTNEFVSCSSRYWKVCPKWVHWLITSQFKFIIQFYLTKTFFVCKSIIPIEILSLSLQNLFFIALRRNCIIQFYLTKTFFVCKSIIPIEILSLSLQNLFFIALRRNCLYSATSEMSLFVIGFTLIVNEINEFVLSPSVLLDITIFINKEFNNLFWLLIMYTVLICILNTWKI